ncbi:MAG TPA: nucleoside deaminase [Acidimicrobiales bacterium]|nr:nucleoside deaminase [Acidimicrobiales bacterium]
MEPASAAWAALSEPWQVAVSQAWKSWVAGSAGVGAALVDGAGSVVARGRNRMAEPTTGRLAGTVMAHAEMDVLSQVPFGTRPSGALYTTFEPCLMCAATILLYRVSEVHYAAADPVFDGLHDWFGTHPFTAERVPRRVHLGGPVGAFCHVLHLAWLVAYPAPESVIIAHGNLAPEHLACAAEVADRHRLKPLAEGGGLVLDALAELWSDLVTLAG